MAAEPNPDAGENKNAPPQKLVLAFSTADVVILGWRLGRLADLLRENNLATIHVLSKRYADLAPARPFVASITIIPISRTKLEIRVESVEQLRWSNVLARFRPLSFRRQDATCGQACVRLAHSSRYNSTSAQPSGGHFGQIGQKSIFGRSVG